MNTDLGALLALANRAVDSVVPRLEVARGQGSAGATTKSSMTDIVTDFDRWTEAELLRTISDSRPDDGFIGEEGSQQASLSGVTWVIDPIDGTTNFVYDLSGFSVSVAARIDGVDAVGVGPRHSSGRAVLCVARAGARRATANA